MEVEDSLVCIGWRPFACLAPVAPVYESSVGVLVAVAGAHYEKTHGRQLRRRSLNALQVIVEPAQVEVSVEVCDRGERSEVDVTGVRQRVAMVSPRPYQKALGSFLYLRQRAPVLAGPAQIDIVPTADVQHGHIAGLRVVMVPIHADTLPVGI